VIAAEGARDFGKGLKEGDMICPDCEGKGIVIALVDGTYCGPMCVSCSRCQGTGEADPQTEMVEIDGTHLMPAKWSSLESGRADPARPVLLDMLERLRATDGGRTAPDRGLSSRQLDELLAWLLD
jgi:hypothetical protein